MKTCRGFIIERMRQRNFRFDPTQAEAFERQSFEKWRTRCQRMNRRANVVNESGQGQFGGACPATDGRVRFENKNGKPRSRECDRGRQTIRAGADYDRVILIRHCIIQ